MITSDADILKLDVTIIDPNAFATPDRCPSVTLLAERPDEALPRLGLDRHMAVLILTHDPKIDDRALSAALRSDCFYIGALGSRKSHAQRLDRLVAMGFMDADLARLHVPIGIDLGTVSPAEIAISILAEIIATLRCIGRTSEPRNLTRRVTDRQIIQPDWICLSSFIHIIGFPPVTAMVAPET